MFVPIPSAAICDLSSRQSRYIAQTVCRKWQNLSPDDWHIFPEYIDLRPDGTGTISSPYTKYTHSGTITSSATQEFTWMLGRDGPLGMEGLDEQALYVTIPKLMQSTRAWTRRPWTSDHSIVPAYIRIELSGPHSLQGTFDVTEDFTIDSSAAGVALPVELIENIMDIASQEEVAAPVLLHVCKWTREMVLSRRRRNCFDELTQQFARWGLAFWIECGHFNPLEVPSPASFFAFRSLVFKLPRASGYPGAEPEQDRGNVWHRRPVYYSGELGHAESATFFQTLVGDSHDHPEVKKVYTGH